MKALLLILLAIPAQAMRVNNPPASTGNASKSADNAWSAPQTFFSSITAVNVAIGLTGASGNIVSKSSITTSGGLFGQSLAVNTATFTVLPSGIISAPSQAGAHVGLAASYTVASGTTRRIYWESVAAGSGGFNNQSTIDLTNSSDTFTTTGGAGFYLFTARIHYTNYQAAAGNEGYLDCTQGSITGPGIGYYAGFISAGGVGNDAVISSIFYDSGGHTIKCNINQASGNTLTYGTAVSTNYASLIKIW